MSPLRGGVCAWQKNAQAPMAGAGLGWRAAPWLLGMAEDIIALRVAQDCLTGFVGVGMRNKGVGKPEGPQGRRSTLLFLSHLETDVLNIPSSGG